MSVAASLKSFHFAPINLWVEDTLTRDYLSKAWGDPPEIAFFLGAGGVRQIVETAVAEGVANVFGVIDRDLRESNFAKWSDAKTVVFILPRHESENYLLDVSALNDCGLSNRGRSAAQIQAEMERLAALQPSWMALRKVLTQLRTDFTHDFPGHLSPSKVLSLADAEEYIQRSDWYAHLAAHATTWTTGGTLTTELANAHSQMQSFLANRTWLEQFSGKEIFGPLRDYVYNHPPGSSPDNDLAKAVGAWQEKNNCVPNDVRDLRAELRRRVGLPP